MFSSSSLFELSRTLLGAWRFSLFRSVYSSFHYSLDLNREPAFYWAFSFPSLSLFVSLYVKMKMFCSFQFNRLAVSWPPLVWVWSWSSYRFLPFTVFCFCFSLSLLACLFVSRVISFIYDVRVRGVVSMFNETSHSFFVWDSFLSVCCPAVLSLLSGLYRVHGLRVSSLCPVARWQYLPPLSFQKMFFFSLFSFSPCVLFFFFYSFF